MEEKEFYENKSTRSEGGRLLRGDEEGCEGTANHGSGHEGVLRIAGARLVRGQREDLCRTYFPVLVSYRSVRARLVGVSLTQVAGRLMNMLRVSAEATAAVKHSQSPAWR